MIRYDRINELSDACGKKKSFLSQAMGYSSRYLIDAKKQNTNISGEPLRILAEELGTTPEYLKGETDDPGIKKAPAQKGESDLEARFRAAAEKLPPELLERELAYLEQLVQKLHAPTDSDM